MSTFSERHGRIIVASGWDSDARDTKEYRDRLVIAALAEGLSLDATARVFRISRKHVERIRRDVPPDVQSNIARDVIARRRRRAEELAEVD